MIIRDASYPIPQPRPSREQTQGVLGASYEALMGGVGAAAMGMLAMSIASSGRRKDLLWANALTNIVGLTLSLANYYFGNPFLIKPAAVIGGFPLGTVTELSHAMSERNLKYRSKGGIFLAHQAGGDQTLRITGKAWGTNRYIFLIILDTLFRYGNGKLVDEYASFTQAGVMEADLISVDMKEVIDETPWSTFNEANLDEGRTEFHLTFPVITQNRVYTNMYIETYDFTEAIEFGMNVLEYTIFFRKYIPEPELEFELIAPPEGADGKTKDSMFYYHPKKDDALSKFKMIDHVFEKSASLVLIAYRMSLIRNKKEPSLEMDMIMSSGYKAAEGWGKYYVDKERMMQVG